MAPPKILIIGCGIAGPTLATLLLLSPLPAEQKPHITILERSCAVDGRDGQNIDIRGTGTTVIRMLGLEAAVRAAATGEAGVQWVDGRNRVWWSSAPDRLASGARSPTAAIEILRGRLAEICRRRSAGVSGEVRARGGAGVEYVFGDHLSALEQGGDGVRVRFASSGEERVYDLVVGADGLHSQTRRMTWGAAAKGRGARRLGMYGAFFSMPRGGADTAWRRWFHATRPARGHAQAGRPGRRDDDGIYLLGQRERHEARGGRGPGTRRGRGAEGADEGVLSRRRLGVREDH